MSTPTPRVVPGQIWADNDRREVGRTLRVESVDDTHATCVVVTEATNRRHLKGSTIGKQRIVALKRFRPTSTGYVLAQDVPAPAQEG